MAKNYLTREQVQETSYLSSRQAARILGVAKTSVNKYRKLYGTVSSESDLYLPNAKVLTIDIESKPMQAYVWSKKADWIPDGQLIDPGGMICFAAKWLGSDEVLFYSDYQNGHAETVKAAHKLLSEADIVITGEGRMDFQTAMGKAPVGVARLARSCRPQVRVLAFCGCATPEAEAVNTQGIDAYFPILHEAMSTEAAMEAETARRNLRQTVQQVFRILHPTG